MSAWTNTKTKRVFWLIVAAKADYVDKLNINKAKELAERAISGMDFAGVDWSQIVDANNFLDRKLVSLTKEAS